MNPHPFPLKGKGAERFVVWVLFFLLYGHNFPIDTHIFPCYPIMVHNNNDTLLFELRVLSLGWGACLFKKSGV